MAESHIDTRTPDEMLDGAVARMFKIAEWHYQTYPRLGLVIYKKYKYSFDKGAIYSYQGRVENPMYPDGYYNSFIRESDWAEMKATKYSESPEEIN